MDIIPLNDFRLPDYPDARLNLNGQPLTIISTKSFSPESTSHLSTPIGIATVLYNWHPTALAAFLDLDAWFSLTWTVSLPPSPASPSSTGYSIEIGRVGTQITIGALDAEGEKWSLMLTFNLTQTGSWIANVKESMVGEEDLTDEAEIARLGQEFVRDLIVGKVWDAGKKVRHRFFVEYAPMDIFGDGIQMSPHWLYKALDLRECTTCSALESESGAKLDRCGRCGTAAYCSGECQKRDWKVHKGICGLDVLERGQMLRITQRGGLIRWDESKTMVEEEGEECRNPNFEEKQFKRVRKMAEAEEMDIDGTEDDDDASAED
jgi:hypothetical protein